MGRASKVELAVVCAPECMKWLSCAVCSLNWKAVGATISTCTLLAPHFQALAAATHGSNARPETLEQLWSRCHFLVAQKEEAGSVGGGGGGGGASLVDCLEADWERVATVLL